jgi:hypothetical protein
MANIAFIVKSPLRAAASLSGLSFLPIAEDLVRQVRNQLGDNGASLVNIALSDLTLVASTYDGTLAAVSNPITMQNGKHNNALVAGGAAGNLTVTGIKTSNRLLLVAKIVDAGQAYTDLTSEFTISAANTINNTGGTTTASSHVVVVWA